MYVVRSPAPALSPFIEHYWFVRAPDAGFDLSVDVFVEARADLIFNYGAAYHRTSRGQTVLHHAPNLDAQRDHPIRIRQVGAVHVVGVRFRVGGLAPFLAVPARSLTNQTPAPERAFGPCVTPLVEALAALDPDACAARLDAWFTAALRSDASVQTFTRAKDLLLKQPSATVEGVAVDVGVSARHLDRLFAQHLGLSPKVLARVVRFQAALQWLRSETRPGADGRRLAPDAPLADVAHACGYYDQSHFTRELRRFTGSPPRDLRRFYPEDAPTDFAPNVIRYQS